MPNRKFSVLITRPEPEAKRLKSKLSKIGFDGVIEPVMKIKFLSKAKKELSPLLNKKTQAVIISSINGAKAVTTLSEKINSLKLRVIAVGDTTADMLKESGFKNIVVAGGNIESVKEYIIQNLKPKKGRIVHCSGNIVASDLQSLLSEYGYDVRRIVLYHSLPSRRLSEKAVKAIKSGELQYVVFYSSRTASIFNRLAKESNLNKYLVDVHAFCFSPRVASVARKMPWKSVNVSNKPNEGALINLVKDFNSEKQR